MGNNSKEFWQKNARRYDRVTLSLCKSFPSMAQAVAETLSDADSVLEVAAGTGMVTVVVAPVVQRHVATDQSTEMLEVLRGRLGEQPSAEVRVADALNLDFPDGSFDVVLMCNLLHLLPEPSLALAEARRVLRPGGRLLAPTFCHGQGLLAHVVSRVLGVIGFPVMMRFKDQALDELVQAAGFELHDARWFPGILPIRHVEGRKAES